MKAPEISQQRLVHSQYTSDQKIRDPEMGVHNPVQRTPQADQQRASRRYWRVALSEGGVLHVEIIERFEIVAITGNP